MIRRFYKIDCFYLFCKSKKEMIMTYLKFKLSRQLRENIWHTKKLTLKQRTLVTSLFKKSTIKKQSDFSKKLQQMKKVAYFYGMRSCCNQMKFNRVVHKVDKKKSLLLTLESRLDVILVRISFCSTLFLARHIIGHKNVLVNSTQVNLPGFLLRCGDVLSIKPGSSVKMKGDIKKSFNFCLKVGGKDLNSYLAPQHLEVNYKTLSAVLLYEPTQVNFPYKIDLDLLF